MRLNEIENDILWKYRQHMISLDPIFKQIDTVKNLHAGGFRYQENNKEATIPINKMIQKIEITRNTIVNFDIETFTISVFEVIKQQIDEMYKMMFTSLSTITQLTGNTYNANGKPLNVEMILEMIEKIQIHFDENDNPILPKLIAATEIYKKLSKLEFTHEHNERLKNIIENKRREYYAKKCHRRLSYIN
jgi:hypothetical protein